MSLQDELNRIAKTTNRTNRDCLNILATGLANIDQSQTTGVANTARLGEVGSKYLGQSFLPTKKNNTGVVVARGASTGTYTGDVTVELRTETAGSPSTTILESVTIPNATWLGYSIGADIPVSFAETLTIDGSTKYWIVLSSSTADNANYTRIVNGSSNPYANGSTKGSANGTSWGADSGNDIYFKTLYSDLEKSSEVCANSWAGTTNLRLQDAINAKAGTSGLSKQDAAKLIATP